MATQNSDNQSIVNNTIFTGTGTGSNTVLGYNSLNPSAGTDCVAIGYKTLTSNVSGTDNLAVGTNALTSNTVGETNVAIGTNCLSSNINGNGNLGLGEGALSSNIDGSGNIGVGNNALFYNQHGDNNTAVGAAALQGSAPFSISNNVGIGVFAGINYSGSESNNICLGSNVMGVVGENNTIHIGNGQLACYIAGIFGVTTSDSGSATAVLIDNTGNLGTIASSIRYKENVKDLGDASSAILSLRPVKFNYIKDLDKTETYGLIAEEVEKQISYLLVKKDGLPESVKYHELPILLLNEIQKQNRRINELESQIHALKKGNL